MQQKFHRLLKKDMENFVCKLEDKRDNFQVDYVTNLNKNIKKDE